MSRKLERSFPAELKECIAKQHRLGCSVANLAMRYGCSPSKIILILRVARIQGEQIERPTREEIRERAAEVREKWTEEDHRKRANEVQEPYEIPVVGEASG